jgi:hypothetical protein
MYTDFFEISSNDPSEFNYWIIDENNNNVTIILKKGLTLRYDITFLSPDEARGKITYNGTITSQEQSISSRNYSGRMGIVVRHSINNRTHWEEYCEYQAFENVTGDLIVSEINTEYSTHIYKWNWKTGWLDYYYFEYWNETAIKSVREISLVHKESLFPFNVLVGGFILGIIILFLLGIKKFK